MVRWLSVAWCWSWPLPSPAITWGRMPSPIMPSPSDVLESVSAPSSNILAKGSLMPEASSLGIVNRPAYVAQVVTVRRQGRLHRGIEPGAEEEERRSSFRRPSTSRRRWTIEVEKRPEEIALAPSPKQVEKAIKLKRTARAKAKDKDTQEGNRAAPRPAGRGKLPRPRRLFRGALRIGTRPDRCGQGHSQPRQGSRISRIPSAASSTRDPAAAIPASSPSPATACPMT